MVSQLTELLPALHGTAPEKCLDQRVSIALIAAADAIRAWRLVGFRNITVHNYRRLDPAIVRTVIEHRIGDFEALGRELLATSPARQAAA